MAETLEDAQRLAVVERERADRLDAEIARLESRLTEVEQARTTDAAEAARLRGELAGLRKEQALVTSRLTAPLRAAERGLCWLAEKAWKVIGVIARHGLFRRRKRG